MRLIDADELMEHVWRDKLDSRELIAKMIDDAPTVKEIPTNIPINIFEQLISQQQESRKDLVSRECENCEYYVNGANDEACDGCFEVGYEHPNFKPKENISKIPFVKLINRLSIEACIHGADAGGSYGQNKDGLVKVLEDIKTYYGLVEYDIGEIYNDDGWSSYGFIKRKEK